MRAGTAQAAAAGRLGVIWVWKNRLHRLTQDAGAEWGPAAVAHGRMLRSHQDVAQVALNGRTFIGRAGSAELPDRLRNLARRLGDERIVGAEPVEQRGPGLWSAVSDSSAAASLYR